jgi:hypothetical protein
MTHNTTTKGEIKMNTEKIRVTTEVKDFHAYGCNKHFFTVSVLISVKVPQIRAPFHGYHAHKHFFSHTKGYRVSSRATFKRYHGSQNTRKPVLYIAKHPEASLKQKHKMILLSG